MHLIDYAHFRDHVVYHGSVSDLDSLPQSTWSYEKKGKKVSHDQPIDDDAFKLLWNGIATSDVFKRNRVRDQDRIIDLVGHHVIGIVFQGAETLQTRLFMVPADESDPEFVDWLETLNVPKGSNSPGPLPTHQASVGAFLKHLQSSVAGKFPSRLGAIRQKVYRSFFGPKWTVSRDDGSQNPRIDVYMFEPGTSERGTERDYYTLVTSGMSEVQMPIPDDATFPRAELLLYVDKPTEQHVHVMRWLARLPHVQKTTWYGPGTTMNNGNPPEPIFEGSELDCYLFLSSIVDQDDIVHRELILDDDPTTMLWVVPITNRERQFIIKRGLDEFLEVLEKSGFELTLDESRRSCIKKKL